MAVLQQSAAPGSVCSTAVCAILRRVCSTAACAVHGRICSTEACAAPGHIRLTAVCVLPSDVSFSIQGLCYTWTSVFCNSLFWPQLGVSLLPLNGSVQQQLVLSLDRLHQPLLPLYISVVHQSVLSTEVRARICRPFKEPRNRFPAWRAGTTTLFVVPARQAT
jgi:hypothetical protein